MFSNSSVCVYISGLNSWDIQNEKLVKDFVHQESAQSDKNGNFQ